MKKFISLFLCVFLLFTMFSSCTKNNNENKKLSLVTTIFPLYDFARQIVGDKAEVTMLLQPGMESHSYEPTPQDIIKIQKCDAFFYIGGESDEWVEDVMESLDTESFELVPLIEQVDLYEEQITEGMENAKETEHESEHSHEHEYDEHIWTSPVNSVTLLEKMSETICLVDSENSDEYMKNTKLYSDKIKEIDDNLKNIVSNSKRNTVVFGDRFPFRYLAEEYSLEYYAAFPGCSSQTEPSASTVAFLIDTVNEKDIPVVFYTEFSDMKMAETICEATSAEKALLHSCHNVTKDDFNSGVTYVELMNKNVDILKEALN